MRHQPLFWNMSLNQRKHNWQVYSCWWIKRLSPPSRIILLQHCWTIVLHNKAISVATTVQVCSTPVGAQRCTMHLRRTNPAALVVGGWANYLELALTQNGTIMWQWHVINELRMECTAIVIQLMIARTTLQLISSMKQPCVQHVDWKHHMITRSE